MAKIFISYSRVDEVFARRIATHLSNAGAEIWLDVKDIPGGMNWSMAIQQGLDLAELMLLIMTPESMNSENVMNEWQYYIDQKKPIIPLLLRPAKPHFQLNRLQYVNFHTQGFEEGVHQLHTELRRKGLRLTTTTPPMPPPFSAPSGRPANTPDKVTSALKSMGVNPEVARFDNLDAGANGWGFQRGSVVIEIYLSMHNDTEYLQVLSPLFYIPDGDVSKLYRRLLELNLVLLGASVGIYLDVVYLFSEQATNILGDSGILTAITSVITYANDLNHDLVKEFGGRPYSLAAPPSHLPK